MLRTHKKMNKLEKQVIGSKINDRSARSTRWVDQSPEQHTHTHTCMCVCVFCSFFSCYCVVGSFFDLSPEAHTTFPKKLKLFIS